MITLEFVKKNEHQIGILAIIVGFTWDSFFLVRPDQLFGNIVLISYIAVAFFISIVINLPFSHSIFNVL